VAPRAVTRKRFGLLAATCALLVVAALAAAGEIVKVGGGNLCRVFGKVTAATRKRKSQKS
jgi:hypothetical protein